MRGLQIPFPFVLVAGSWPSDLIAARSLDLPILGAYFPARYHRFFKPKGVITSWFTPSDVPSSLPEGTGLLLSGSATFVDGVLNVFSPTPHRVIASVLIRLRDATVRGLWKDRALARPILVTQGLRPVVFPDSDNGGATDAYHMIGFGAGLCLSILPSSSMGLPCTLRHFLDGGATGSFPDSVQVVRSSVPVGFDPQRKVLWHSDTVLGEGLLPCSRPRSLVLCPSHFFPRHWIRRMLTLPELFCLYQLPLELDTGLCTLSPDTWLPFEDSPPPDLYVSIFRQIWGVEGGFWEDKKGIVEGIVEDEKALLVKGEEVGREEGGEVRKEGVECRRREEGGEVRKEGVECRREVHAKVDKVLPSSSKPSDPPSRSRVMTASTLDTRSEGRSSHGSRRTLHIDFGDTFVDVGDSLTDDDTVTLGASDVTLRTSYSEVREDVALGVERLPRMGSFGVHGEAQRESLCLVEEAKAFSKAVKADDAEVPMHL